MKADNKGNEFPYFAIDDTFDETKVETPEETEEQKRRREAFERKLSEDIANGKYNIK